jgi:predicted TPR repeat methyltransferase
MADQPKGFLDNAYTVETPDQTKAFYNDWAETYEAEIKANGYATPTRCAAALAALAPDNSVPVLDLGCGTGLSGEALRAAGFSTIDGTDFSEEMLAHAEGKPGLYRKLTRGDLNRPLPAEPGQYTHVAAIGVFSPSHAPAAMIDRVLEVLPAGGLFTFSLNDHTLEDPSFEARVTAVAAAGTAEVVFREYGAHLPGHGLKALIYVLRKG